MTARRTLPALELALAMLELMKTRELTRDDLAAHFDVHPTTVWRALHPLVNAGLVREREVLVESRGARRFRLHYATKAWGGVL